MVKNTTSEIIRNSLQKRQAALNRFVEREREFRAAKAEITAEIEEARATWIRALEQLPKMTFDP
jgi:hypothetical protein